MDETELIIKISVVMIVWYFIIALFVLIVGTSPSSDNPSLNSLSNLQTKIQNDITAISYAFQHPDIFYLNLITSIGALMIDSVLNIIVILFVIIPSLFGNSFGSLGAIVAYISAFITIIIAFYSFTLITRIISRILGGNN